MTDPNEFVAAQIGQQAALGQPAPVSEQEIAQAAQAQAGMGVTGVDVEALAAQIKAMQARLDEADAAATAAKGNPLADTVKSLGHFLAGHGDARAIALGEDLAAAVADAATSGSVGAVAQIGERLYRHLTRNAPYPGENYFHRNAVAFAGDLPELIDGFRPASASGSQVALPAGKVVAGSVVG
jgi:hypothetical protein